MKKAVLLLVVSLCLAACHCERRTNGIPCRKAAQQAAKCQADCAKCPCMKTVAEEAARNVLKEQEALRKAEQERLAAEQARQNAAAHESISPQTPIHSRLASITAVIDFYRESNQ